MKKTQIIGIAILFIGFLSLSGFVGLSKSNSEPKEASLSGGWYYMSLNLTHSDKSDNYNLFTPVFHSTERPKCSDLMKHANAHYDDYNYGNIDNKYCVSGSYKSEGEANKARDKSIASSKSYNFKILYTSFTGY